MEAILLAMFARLCLLAHDGSSRNSLSFPWSSSSKLREEQVLSVVGVG